MPPTPRRLCLSASLALAFAMWASSRAQEGAEDCIAEDFASRNTVGLQCSFHDEARVSLWCDELSRALDYAPFITFPFYVHTRYELRGLAADVREGGDDNVTVCLGLRKITTRRVVLTKAWKNVSISDLEPYKLFLLVGATDFLMETSYNESVPVGYVSLDADCWMSNRERSGCAREVRVATQMVRPVLETNPYVQEYWEELKDVRGELLGEHDGLLHMDFQHDYNLSAAVYVAPFVSGAIQLRELRVTGVDLSRLPASLAVIASLPALRLLHLPDDNIQHLQPEIFLNVSNVENLSLAHNKLRNIPAGISHLCKLTSLDLSGNPLETSEEGMRNFTEVLKTLRHLKWLSLASINVKNLGLLLPLLGKNGIKLSGLDLSYCGLTSISDEGAVEIFESQTDLEVLRLVGNKFREVLSSAFVTLHYLKELNLSSCGLTEGPQLELSPRTVLANLDMSHNNLSFSERIVSSGCVTNLDLSNNSIKYWSNPDVFEATSRGFNCWSNVSARASGLTYVKNLNLSYNSMSALTLEMTDSLQQLMSVDLGANPVDCNDCHTPELQGWLRLARQSGRPRVLVAGSNKPLVCWTPVSKQGAPVTEVVFDTTACEPRQEPVNYALVLGLPLTAVVAVITCVVVLMYVYRFELTYLMHLVKMKRRRSNVMLYASHNYQYDAFVCYSGPDRAWVIGKLLPRMEQQPTNYRLCLHERDFVLGSFITSNIVTSMQNSRFTIVVLTNSFVQSQWCQWELEMANHKLFEDDSDFLILLELERLDRATVPRHLKYLMDTRTYLEWPQDSPEKEQEGVWKRLEAAMGYSLSNRLLTPAPARLTLGNVHDHFALSTTNNN